MSSAAAAFVCFLDPAESDLGGCDREVCLFSSSLAAGEKKVFWRQQRLTPTTE
jgi:hypothetical protein